MAKGDIVFIPFTDSSGSKLRPAVVLTDNTLDLTVCFITSQTAWQESTDVLHTPTAQNGLKLPSLIRISKIATLSRSLEKGILGKLSPYETTDLNNKLKILLHLS